MTQKEKQELERLIKKLENQGKELTEDNLKKLVIEEIETLAKITTNPKIIKPIKEHI